MALAELHFSDLLIMPDGAGLLKGCPCNEAGADQRLIPVPDTLQKEIALLASELPEAFLRCARLLGPESSVQEIPKSIRHTFRGVTFRVASATDVNNEKTWFLRRLPDRVPLLDALGLPEWLIRFFRLPENQHGLVIFCGSQSSGKTTTASAILADRLTSFGGHAITLENPCEHNLSGCWGDFGRCIQVEIFSETELSAHIEMGFRYGSPNIFFIGEAKSRFAAHELLLLSLGSNRQLVLTTLHGLSVIAALERLLNWARMIDGDNALQNLANSLLAVVRLDLRSDGHGNKRIMHVDDFLLVPFKESSDKIRAILREGNLQQLTHEICGQSNRIGMRGLLP